MKELILMATMAVLPMTTKQATDEATPAHVVNRFEFTVQAPLERAAPLFGPEGERCWAGKHWDPKFVYPQPAHDRQGAVFTVAHGNHTSIWVSTIFDLTAGRMQYVAVVPDAFTSTIDVRLSRAGAATHVEVTYVRTALDVALNEDVKSMGDQDRESGPDWQQAITDCLAKRSSKR